LGGKAIAILLRATTIASLLLRKPIRMLRLFFNTEIILNNYITVFIYMARINIKYLKVNNC
jgi:hypothetical protein